ncbi:HAD-IC family P-type ATPase, partial [Schleiferilactobacillus harbinensis]|uniref:HAD-IC family P-type ATPase n=1 Tax=Schleiferilactobacillus harbinensis TaxID=304207 RepID=UPI0039EBBC5A
MAEPEAKKQQLQEQFYNQSIDTVREELDTSLDGLTPQDADKRFAEYGANALAEGKRKSNLMRFIDQFKDFMIIVLLVAALVSGFVGHEWADAAIILAVVLINAIMGVIQESKAEEAIDALREMSTPDAHVRRGGQVLTIKSEQLVPGDVVLLEAGDIVPADLRLTDSASLKIEESALTGESVPVDKDVATLEGDDIGIGDRTTMAFMNANVTYGRGAGIVVGTGMN